MVLGKDYAWEDLTVVVANAPALEISEVSWNVENGLIAKYGKGRKPNKWSRGNWKATGKIAMALGQHKMFMAIAGDKGILNIMFNVMANYSNEEFAVAHNVSLLQCMIDKIDESGKQGSDHEVSYDLLVFGDVGGTDANGVWQSYCGKKGI